MHLAAKEDIDATIEKVFAVVSDFNLIEQVATQRAIEVERVTDSTPPAAGMEWEATFGFRGKPRSMTVTLAEFTPPEAVAYNAHTGGLDIEMRIELVALSPAKTRLHLKTDLKPANLSARLLVQSLKLAKSTIEKKLDSRVAEMGRGIEKRIKAA
ncbi:SRPBCC family protein [Mesobacterium sp. TK19101]|uniref:SRPBCC family protein n=1 Tax=Mesobacterium hydrothermale TaxID=3111907 RepID=A0ABU6HB20_9RHOB|nr:SRPBCC family protein [Mesobacterium sp. TK19101]MEC3859678.1 SRPBCC family protein [Mesobacterium sp. TK19101]